MTSKFETMGITFQNQAYSKEKAIESFKISCTICAKSGMRLECERCEIKQYHTMVLTAFDDNEQYNIIKAGNADGNTEKKKEEQQLSAIV